MGRFQWRCSQTVGTKQATTVREKWVEHDFFLVQNYFSKSRREEKGERTIPVRPVGREREKFFFFFLPEENKLPFDCLLWKKKKKEGKERISLSLSLSIGLLKNLLRSQTKGPLSGWNPPSDERRYPPSAIPPKPFWWRFSFLSTLIRMAYSYSPTAD